MNNQENLRPIVPKETRLQIKKFGDELAIRTTSLLSENNYYRIAFCQWFFSLDDNEYNEKKRWYLRAQDNTLYTGILMDRAVKEVLTGKISSYLNNWEKHVRRINVPVYINNRIVHKDWDKEFETEVLNPIEDPFKSVPAAGFDIEHLKYLADEMAIIKKDIEEFRSKRVWNQIFFYNDKFFLCFPYSANMVVNVKSSFKSYKWRSEEKWWEIASSETKAIRDFALMHKFSFHKNATEFLFGNAEKINASQMVVSDFKVAGFKKEPYPYQNAGIQFGNKAKKILIADEMGLGKDQNVNELALTPYGWRKMGSLKVGDEVIGSNGKPTKILGVFPQGIKDQYKITFSDGFSAECGLEHLWTVFNASGKKRTLTVKQMLSHDLITEFGVGHNEKKQYKIDPYYKKANGNNTWQIPIVEPVYFETDNTPILDPYLLGLILGDGHSSATRNELKVYINNNDTDIIEYLSLIGTINTNGQQGCIVANLNEEIKNSYRLLGLKGLLANSKFIPKDYMMYSPDNRLLLLQGLMDTDGHASNHSTEYSTVSVTLAYQVCELVQSLGGIARISSKIGKYKNEDGVDVICQKAYRINIKLHPSMNPFKCKRKSEVYDVPTKYLPARYITNIEYVYKAESVCIKVDAKDCLYVTRNYIVTHNTIQSIGIVMSHLSFPCLVVAPKSLLYNWENEWKKFTNHKPYVFYNSKYPLDTVLSIANVVIINYETAKKLLPYKDRFKSIIVDESHNVKNDKTKRFTEILELANGKDVRCLLTGTPIMNAPQELIPQLKILDMIKDKNTEKKFKDRYCGKHGGDNLDELNIKLRSSVMIRREKKDVLTDLPDLVRNYVKVDITTREEYNRAENDFVNYLKEVKEMSDRKIKAAMNAEILVKMGILKQISARGKIEAILEYCKSAFDENQKIILFGYHREVLHEYTKRLNSNLLITGATKIEDRQKYVDMFQNDPKQMSICLSIRAASVGLTLTASSNEVFAEFDWTSAMHDQAEARAHRIGQKNSVSANYFVGIDTIDSDIVELINFKRNMINEMTGTKHNVSENSTIIKDLLKKRYNFEPEGEIQA